MLNLFGRYTRWLHTRWPAGTVEKLPDVREDGSTSVPGVYIVGDLTGVPLLKFSADTGTKAVRTLIEKDGLTPGSPGTAGTRGRGDDSKDQTLDLAIIGAGVSGIAAALEAKQQGLRFAVYEAAEPFFTIVNFPKAKPIYTYPTDMTPAGSLQFHEKSEVKEGLLEDLREQMAAADIEPINARVERVRRRGGRLELDVHPADGEPHTVRARGAIVAIGRSGNFRTLDVPGEELDKVYNRLHDPQDFCGQEVLVVGGGDSAMETAIALAECGAKVSLSYRRDAFSRPKPENVEKLYALVEDADADVRVEEPTSAQVTTPTAGYLHKSPGEGCVRLYLPSRVEEIREREVVLRDAHENRITLPNDSVFAMIGREPPLEFFRRSGVRLTGEWSWRTALGPALFLLLCFWVYSWKDFVPYFGELPGWLNPDPGVLAGWLKGLGGTIGAWVNDPSTLPGVIVAGMASPAFYYTLAYSLLVVVFGFRRIRRRKTPYVTVQTLTLMAVQVVPLFILPVIVLPWLGANGVFDAGVGGWIKQQFFPGESWWRAYGLILAWPLMVWNWFTAEPIWGWLVLGFLQTFVAIPAMIYFWGKGAYCGWICSCGAMAETLGDTQRHKMPHGPFWNRLNMVGQAILGLVAVMMVIRIVGWALPDGNWAARLFSWMHTDGVSGAAGGSRGALNYWWMVDLFLAGMLGYGLYFFMSGRVWCRFACPLAALMHIYARFSQFRILAEKKKCISCNVCTSVCHQGIDVMSFANKGLPMEDPECVRCSACVQSCPTGVLQFGRINRKTGEVLAYDSLPASPVLIAERKHATLTHNGKPVAS